MEDEEEFSIQEETQQVLKVLQALKQASQDLQTNPEPNSSESDSPIKALLELETESNSLLSSDPNLSNLSHHLSDLKTLISSLQKSKLKHGLRSFLTRRVKTHEITRVAESIESEIQSWIDRETISNLSSELEKISSLESNLSSDEEDDLVRKLGKVHGEIEEDQENKGVEVNKKKSYGEKRFLERHPFASCVARFAVQLEIGEGLRQREKRAFKQEILKKIREASNSDAEAATIVAEVLWGSSP
uniref:Uncharacterized protein n=1 Tax=Nicotiana tabacum TaxID=4097 RepID=A0A1S4CZE5_TOBAC|nr:PREDICTED: uncharacterized protein LOC107824307 [Nicotiana tabacum]